MDQSNKVIRVTPPAPACLSCMVEKRNVLISNQRNLLLINFACGSKIIQNLPDLAIYVQGSPEDYCRGDQEEFFDTKKRKSKFLLLLISKN